MEQLQQQQHVEDVGRILLQTQDQLRQLREQLAGQQQAPANSNNAGAEIDEILQRAERELRAKAELVLQNLVTAAPTSPTLVDRSAMLPLVRKPGGVGSPSGHRRRPNDSADSLDLNYFKQRFTNAAVDVVASPVPSASKRSTLGRLAKHKTTAPPRLLPYVHKVDPQAPRPQLEPADAQQGVLSLLNRGLLPTNVDLTPAFQSVRRAGGVTLYNRSEQPVRAVPFANPTNFNLATLKFDLQRATAAAEPETDVSTVACSPPHRKDGLKTVTIQFPQPSSSDHRLEEDDEAGDGGGDTTKGEDPTASDSANSDDVTNSMDELRRNVDKIRGYNELLDTYSLHQFIIHKGRALRDTPEFQSFQRVGAEQWGSVEEVIKALEQLLTRYFVPLAYVDGQRLLAVAAMELPVLTKRELLACIVNEDQVASLLRRPGQRYKGKDRKHRAATTLQAFFKMLVKRNRFRKLRRNGASAIAIQTAYRAHACRQRLRKQLSANRATQRELLRAKTVAFREQWSPSRRRVVVHVPSLSLDERARLRVDNLGVLQNLQQLARLAMATDPLVELVYVAPFELPSDVWQYALKLLQLAGVAQPQTRVKLVVPEHAAQFPPHTSLAAALLYSPHALRKIRKLVTGKLASLVMGTPGAEDERVALALQVPLWGLPHDSGTALLTRSGAKRFFLQADVNVPTGTYDLYDVDELLFALAKLAVAHVDQRAWLLRLDHDPFGTGAALVDVAALTTLKEMRREKKPQEYWKQPGIRDTVTRALLQELERSIASITKPSHSELYPSWAAYAAAIAEYGAVIEAVPATVVGVVRANVMVSPSGEVQLQSTHDVLTSSGRRRPVAFAFPQSLVPHEALVGAATAVGRRLAEDYTFMGYASVDLQLHRESDGSERLWAVALHPFLTDAAATFATFHALHAGELQPRTGEYQLASTLATRCYVGVDYVNHPNVSTMSYAAFFHTCRLHGVCFDVERRVGSVFALADSLTAGVLGLLSSAESRAQAAQYLRTAFEVIARDVGTHSGGGHRGGEDNDGSEDGNFGEVLRVVRHHAASEKEREKEKARDRREATAVVATEAEALAGTQGPTPSPTPTLRVGKMDQLRRMRRSSQ